MSKFCLVSLIGLPGAGKTTFCKNFKSIYSGKFQIKHFCFDDYIHLENDTSVINKKSSLKDHRKFVLNQVGLYIKTESEAQTNSSAGGSEGIYTIIFLDDNNYYRGMRYEIYKLSCIYNIAYAQIFINIPLDVAIKRNSLRNTKEKLDEQIIIEMNKKLQQPSRKYKWELPKNSLIFTLNDNEFVSLKATEIFLENCIRRNEEWEKLMKFKNENDDKSYSITTVAVEHSLLHKIDLKLRKKITETINISFDIHRNKTEMTEFANNLNMKRKEILNDIKKGIIEFSATDEMDEIVKIVFELLLVNVDIATDTESCKNSSV